jgi:hypothetical protein
MEKYYISLKTAGGFPTYDAIILVECPGISKRRAGNVTAVTPGVIHPPALGAIKIYSRSPKHVGECTFTTSYPTSALFATLRGHPHLPLSPTLLHYNHLFFSLPLHSPCIPHLHFRRCTETIPLIYSVNTFSLNTDTAILHLPLNIRPSYLNEIRHLRCDIVLDFVYFLFLPLSYIPTAPLEFPPNNHAWPRAIHILSTLQSLRSLRTTIALCTPKRLPSTWQIQQALEPFRGIRQCSDFEIRLMWTVPKELREVLGETPFVLNDGDQMRHERSLWLGESSGWWIDDGRLNRSGY